MSEANYQEVPKEVPKGFDRFKRVFRDNFAKIVGLKEQDISSISEAALTSKNREERQKLLFGRITESLRRKGILASEEEANEYYSKAYRRDLRFLAPEVLMSFKGAFFIPDNNRIYLNPGRDMFPNLFPIDYQLITIIEEAIHWGQERKSHVTSEVERARREVQAKEKLLRMAKFLDLDEKRIRWLTQEKLRSSAELKVISEPPLDSKPLEHREDFEPEVGKLVNVKRSSGVIEGGWTITVVDEQEVIAIRREKGEIIEKQIPLDLVYEFNA